MVDGEHALQRALVDENLLAAARRCRETWHSLQELAGVRSSQAERLLARERKVWEEQKRREIEALTREAKPATSAAPAAGSAGAPAAPAVKPVAAEAEPEQRSDDPYIETPRCTSCNECTNLNNRMFAYDANKQAYIADVSAGTYRELVEAAESCQVSIIHPGKPRNPDEPGIAELLKRAEPFL
jgi:ferredoxin